MHTERMPCENSQTHTNQEEPSGENKPDNMLVQTFSFQNCEKVNLHFNHPGLVFCYRNNNILIPFPWTDDLWVED